MNFLQRIANLMVYEWRRSLAKKKIYGLVILALAFQIGVFAVYNYFFTNPPHGFVIGPSLEEIKATMWLVGVLGPQGLFMPLVAIIVAGGSMSEEYEHGTAEIMLSKPITKIEYMTGKYLGGLSLLSLVIALITALGVVLAYGLFGPQDSLQFVPAIYLSLVYANLLYLSLTFMFSEVFRRTTLTILASVGIFAASTLIGHLVLLLHEMTNEQLYLDINMVLPWTMNFPSFVASELITMPESPFGSFMGGDVPLAASIIAVYTIVSILTAVIRLVKSDVTKKVD